MASSAETTVKRTASGVQLQYGNHIDTIESVDEVFRTQRKLSFSYGAVFFAVTLFIPASSVWWKTWYAVEIWGGFTLNFMVVSLLYYVFLWGMCYSYMKRADGLDEKLMHMADEIEAKIKAGGAS